MDPVTLAAISVGTALVGTGVSVYGSFQEASAREELAEAQMEEGRLAQAAADARALQLEQQAGQERAQSQRAAEEQRRRLDRAQSSLQARAAASGAGALDPTVLDIAGELEEEGEYRALAALYEGEEAGRGLEYSAALERLSGQGAAYSAATRSRATRRGAGLARTRGITTALSGLGSAAGSTATLLDKYGGGSGEAP